MLTGHGVVTDHLHGLDGGRGHDSHAENGLGANWGFIWKQMWGSLLFLLLIAVVQVPLRHLYLAKSGSQVGSPSPEKSTSGLQKLIIVLFGAPGVGGPPKAGYGMFATNMIIGQFVLSALTSALWVYKTYTLEVEDWVANLEFGTATFFCVWLVLKMLINEFSFIALFSLEMLVDIFTMVPLMMQYYNTTVDHKMYDSWISFTYLRCFTAIWASRHLDASGLMDNWGDMWRGIFLSLLDSVCMVYVLAATVFLLEVLGPMSFLHDSMVETSYGDQISMCQMLYWTMTTVSTVGYGDFHPKTMLSRGFNAFAIVMGVVFFTVQTGEIYRLKELEESGRGKFIPKNPKKGHVLILGGACDKNAMVVLRLFTQELLNPARGTDLPEVVLLCFNEADNEMLKFLRDQNGKVKFLRGKSLLLQDLRRARAKDAAMVFILADLFTQTPDYEDQHNILNASFLIKFFPNVPMRLMLLRPENRKLALHVGISRNFCFAVNEMKAIMMAQATITPGFVPFVLNLACLFDQTPRECSRSRDVPNDSRPMRGGVGMFGMLGRSMGPGRNNGGDNGGGHVGEAVKRPRPTLIEAFLDKEPEEARWEAEYSDSAQYSMHGLLVHPDFDGLTFQEMIVEVYERTGAVALAHMAEGMLTINPVGRRVAHRDVIFVAAANRDTQVVPLMEEDNDDWVRTLRANRKMMQLGVVTDVIQQNHLKENHNMSENQATAVVNFSRHLTDHVLKMEGVMKIPKGPVAHTIEEGAAAALADGSGNLGLNVMSKVSETVADNRQKMQEELNPYSDPEVAWGFEPKLRKVPFVEQSAENRLIVPAMNLHARSLRNAAISRSSVSPSSKEDDVQLLPLRRLCRQGGHVVIIAIDDNLWQQLLVLVSTLRQSFLEEWRPIVVVCPHAVPGYLSAQYGQSMGVIYHQANPLLSETLLAVGCIVAESILVLQHQPLTTVELQMDQHLLVAASLIEAEQNEICRDVYMVIDIHSPDNISQLFYSVPGAKMKELDISDAAKPKQNAKAALQHVPPSKHPRFAAGRMMSRAHLCRIFATAFFTPGVMEVIEALCMPTQRNQGGMLWLVPVPFTLVGKTYGEIFKQLILKVGVLLMGLYRASGSLDNNLEYVSSFCPPETVLMSTDKLYVHASPEWAAGVIAYNRRANNNAGILQKAWRRHCKGDQLHRRLPWRIQMKKNRGLKLNMLGHVPSMRGGMSPPPSPPFSK